MRFIAIINREIRLGFVLNALAHMTLGLGHRLEGTPDVGIYFANTAKVREFRQLAFTISMEQSESAAFSDYPHTMHGDDTLKQWESGKNIPEADMQYFGSCFIAEQLDPRMKLLLSSCSKLKNYTPHFSDAKAKLLPPRKNAAQNEVTAKKIVMLINSKLPMAQTLNAAILSTLNVGGRADHVELSLMDWMDKDGFAHSNISFHPFPILKPIDSVNHSEMAERARQSESLISDTQLTLDGQPLVTVVFGNVAEVGDIAPKALARLFSGKLKDADFVPASGDELNECSHTLEKNILEQSDEKTTEKFRFKQSKAPISFSLEDKAALTPDILQQIEKILDEASTEACTMDTTALKTRFRNDIIAIESLVKNEKKSKVYIQKFVSGVLSEVSAKGQIESAKYIVDEYSEYITPEDFNHSAQCAQINSHNEIYDLLTSKITVSTYTV